MELIKCPICQEEYHPSYKSCPFCEEAGEAPARKPVKRHITTRQKAQSARGGIILVLTLVLALFGWYLFGGKAPEGETAPVEPAVETVNPAQNAADGETGEQTAEPTPGGEPTESTEPIEPTEPTQTAETPAVTHVDASALSLKTNVSGTLPKDPMTGYYDCSLKRSDNIRLIVTGTDVAVSGWQSENTGVVSVDAQGNLTVTGSGMTHVIATVGDAKLTCIVRVRG